MRVGLFVALLLSFAPLLAAQEAEPTHEPVPFTADTLRAAISAGEQWHLRIQQPPDPDVSHTMTFLAVSDEGATVEVRFLDPSGEEAREPIQSETTWAELEAHAHYRSDQTEVEEATITLPVGTWEGWRYTVDNGDGTTTTAEFARDLPGPPIRLTVRMGETAVYKMELIEHTDGAQNE